MKSQAELQKDRAVGNDLKLKIMEFVGNHPAWENSNLVFAALAELALTLAINNFGDEARDIWIGAFDAVVPKKAKL